jgi:hypothetical protein
VQKFYFILLLLLAFTITVEAQIDSKNKSTSIPAIKSKKDSTDTKTLLPSKPINNNTINGMSVPKTNTNINLPKKEFSMFGEKFGNPGELYEKQFNKKNKALEVELGLGTKGSKTDQYFGDFKTKSKSIRVTYRDFGLEDGDYIRISVNDEILEYRVKLTNGNKSFKLELKKGFNKIDFLALNEGYALPNTAEFKVMDDQGDLISGNQWNLSTGVKATIIIVKE